MDEFEKQIREQRAGLDGVEDIPTSKLWTNIEERMVGRQSVSRVRLYQRWLAAASVLLVFALGFAALGWRSQPERIILLSDIAPELAEQELVFQNTISRKEAALKLDELDQEAFAPFFDELDLLDSIRSEYLRELPNFGANERLLNTITRYYELKIHLLEQLENDLAKQQYYGISNDTNEI